MEGHELISKTYGRYLGRPLPDCVLASLWHRLDTPEQRAGIVIVDVQCGGFRLSKLIALGADLNISYGDQFTPLAAAIYCQRYEVIRRLCAAGANVNGSPHVPENRRPLWFAYGLGDGDCMGLLYELGARPSERFEHILHKAEMSNDDTARNVVLLYRQHTTRIDARISRARRVVQIILHPAMRKHLGLPRDLAVVLARNVWDTRVDDGWDVK